MQCRVRFEKHQIERAKAGKQCYLRVGYVGTGGRWEFCSGTSLTEENAQRLFNFAMLVNHGRTFEEALAEINPKPEGSA